jgi:peptide/nickel transport system substrate-binding protein
MVSAFNRLRPIALGLTFVVLTACTQAQIPRTATPRDGAGASASAPALGQTSKRITAAITGSPSIMSWTLAHNSGQTTAGTSAVDAMLNSRLVAYNDQGALFPQLAQSVPSVENGQWVLLPDGRMEVTWRIRDGVRWHDGAPFTSQDLLFSAQVIQDKEVAVFSDVRYGQIDRFEALDDHTFVVYWKQPHLEAVDIFTVAPLPRHLLEQAYTANKASFVEQHYWSEEFIGTGPFKLAELSRGSHLVLKANEGYRLGRPHLDEIMVRFIPDGNAMMANILTGGVDLTMGQTLSLDQSAQLQQQWQGGSVVTTIKNMWLADPQHIEPTPAVVGNVEFRRALLHGLDRQALADSIGYGAPVAHSIVSPISADLKKVEAGIVKYDYDPGRAARMIESLGYTRGGDDLYQDATGERLTIEVRTAPGDTNERVMLAVANGWQQMGLATSPFLMSAAQNQDAYFRATFPAISVRSHATNLNLLRYFFHSSVARTPERNFLGSNALRYRNAEMDGLIERYFATIPEGPRMEIATQAVRHITENVVTMHLFHGTSPTVVGSRLLNVGPGGERAEQTWNSETWDLRS